MRISYIAFLLLLSIIIWVGIVHVGALALAVAAALFIWVSLTPELYIKLKNEGSEAKKSYYYSLFFAYAGFVFLLYQAAKFLGVGLFSGFLDFSAELTIMKTNLISIYLHPEHSGTAAHPLYLFSRVCELVFVCMLPLFYWEKERFLGWVLSEFSQLEKDGVNRSAVAGTFCFFILVVILFFYYFGVDQDSYRHGPDDYWSFKIQLICTPGVFLMASLSSFAFKWFKIS